jgi:ribonuclease-3
MEEEPTMAAPNLEAEKTSFIIEQEKPETASAEKSAAASADKPDVAKEKPAASVAASEDSFDDEFDLSDITHNKQDASREDIIAAAEAAAFEEEK